MRFYLFAELLTYHWKVQCAIKIIWGKNEWNTWAEYKYIGHQCVPKRFFHDDGYWIVSDFMNKNFRHQMSWRVFQSGCQKKGRQAVSDSPMIEEFQLYSCSIYLLLITTMKNVFFRKRGEMTALFNYCMASTSPSPSKVLIYHSYKISNRCKYPRFHFLKK